MKYEEFQKFEGSSEVSPLEFHALLEPLFDSVCCTSGESTQLFWRRIHKGFLVIVRQWHENVAWAQQLAKWEDSIRNTIGDVQDELNLALHKRPGC